MSRDRLGVMWGGLGLIALGIVFLLAQLTGWDRIWPIFPILAGVAFFVAFAVTGWKDSGFVFVGTLAILVGLFLFAFTLGYVWWEDMKTLWPVFPLIGGVAFVALFLVERRRDVGTLGVGCVAMIVGVVGLAITFGFLGTNIVQYWPLLLVFLGIVALVGGVFQMLRRE